MTRRQAVGWLVLVCLVWGVSFTVTKQSLTLISPLWLMTARFALASLLLVGSFRGISRYEVTAGVLLGVLFWGGFVFQTGGLEHTTPSRSAFITSLSSPLVPIVFILVHRALPDPRTVAGVILAGVGMYFLTLPDTAGGSLNRGDLLTLGCALFFAGQIVAVGYFSRQAPPVRLLAVEISTTAVLSLALAPVLGPPPSVVSGWLVAALVFLAFSGLWTFYMQLRAQQLLSPSLTALIFMLEPVFAAFTSFLVLDERLRPVQWLGAALILAAMSLPAFGKRPAQAPVPLVP